MVSSERSDSDLSTSTVFYFFLIFLHLYKSIFGENMKKIGYFFGSFFQITSLVQRFCKFQRLHRKNDIKTYQAISSFYLRKYLNSIRNRFFLLKK